jgi:LPS-assembly lipoprotein
MMRSRRAFLASGVAVALTPLAGCGWAPLYADRATGPADKELAAIKVAPMPERIGQSLALRLRQWLNPEGEPVPSRYLLRTLLQTTRLDLGIITFGLGTRARFDVTATFTLLDIATSASLFTATSHAAESFDIVANYYANVVAEENARERAVEEISRDMVIQLTTFLQRRAAPGGPVP